MWKKLIILSLSVAVLLFLAAPITPVDAGGKSQKINWRVAGSIVDLKTYTGPEEQVLVLLKAIGAPGRADLTIMGYIGIPGSIEVDGCILAIPFDGDDFVAVFDDLSMLFATLSDDEGAQAYVCINPGQTTTGKFDMQITGGTGRFDGATGYFTATIVSHSRKLSGSTGLGAESGRFIGRIEFGD